MTSKQLWLVFSTVEHTEYMGRTRRSNEIDIVEASSAEEAKNKVVAHYDGQTREYEDYYFATVDQVKAVIR